MQYNSIDNYITTYCMMMMIYKDKYAAYEIGIQKVWT